MKIMKKELAVSLGILVLVNVVLIVGIVKVGFGGEQMITGATVFEEEENETVNESIIEVTGKFVVDDKNVEFIPDEMEGGDKNG